MTIKRICVIAQAYPTETDPIFSFLGEVVEKFAEHKIECYVITPISYIERKHKARSRTVRTRKGQTIHIICPKFIMFPSRKIGSYNTRDLSIQSFCSAAHRAFKKYVKSCDVIYSHFINMAGIAASHISQREGIPCVTASGESNLKQNIGIYRSFSKEISHIGGFIAVSTVLKKEILELGLTKDSEKIICLPNGVDLSKFHKIDRNAARESIGIPQEKFSIIFVGHFIERKGIEKVISAVNECEDVYGIFIGGETLPKQCDKALVVQKVSHDKLPIYLSAADVFVLPTLNEGCCNAVLEAQACGLPIITSDRPFNYDIVDKKSALLVDPTSISELKNAILNIKRDEALRNSLGVAGLKRAEERDIDVRVKKIIDFLSTVCG